MGEKIVNGFLLMLSLFYTICARQYSFGTPTAPKTGFLPQLVGYAAVVISAYLLVVSLVGKGDAKDVKLRCDYKRLGLLIFTMALYIVFFKTLGYLISTILLLFITMKIGKVKGWKLPLVIAVLVSVFFYAVFKIFLAVPLPSGIFFK